jgi:hypothetical protein
MVALICDQFLDQYGEIAMFRIATHALALLAVPFAFSCAAAAAPSPAENDEPVCEQGTWAAQGEEKKYVCLFWRFRGDIYTLDELETVLAPLGKRVPVAVGPAPNPESTTRRDDPPKPVASASPAAEGRRAPDNNDGAGKRAPVAVGPAPNPQSTIRRDDPAKPAVSASPAGEGKRARHEKHDDDDDDDDC